LAITGTAADDARKRSRAEAHAQYRFDRDGFRAVLFGVGVGAPLDELDTYRCWVFYAGVIYASYFSGATAFKVASADDAGFGKIARYPPEILSVDTTTSRARLDNADLSSFKPRPTRRAGSITNLDSTVHPVVPVPVPLANDAADRLFDINRLRCIINRRRRRP
jgi:hypothetical protein